MFDKTVHVLSSALDLYMVRHSIINDNIANAETPGFKARRVSFESEMQKVITNNARGVGAPLERQISSIRPRIFEDPKSEVGLDRNSVDMDREMAQLTKNDIKYSAASQAISRKFSLLKYAIREGVGQ